MLEKPQRLKLSLAVLALSTFLALAFWLLVPVSHEATVKSDLKAPALQSDTAKQDPPLQNQPTDKNFAQAETQNIAHVTPPPNEPLTSDNLQEMPEVFAFFEVPEEELSKIPADCFAPLNALSQEFDFKKLDKLTLFEEVKAWNQSRGGQDYVEVGNTSEAVSSDYDSYNQNTLLKLADQGDMLAHQKLGQSFLVQQGKENQAKAEYHLTQAAIFGSAQALIDLVSLEGTRRLIFKSDDKPTEAIESAIRAQAWIEVARRRGSLEVILNMSSVNAGQLTTDQTLEAHLQADELYQSLTKQRESAGLPPFDNTLPLLLQIGNRMTAMTAFCNP